MHRGPAFDSDRISVIPLDVLPVVSLSVPFGRGVADASGLPMVYGTITSSPAIPGSGPRCLYALVLIYLFILVRRIKF